MLELTKEGRYIYIENNELNKTLRFDLKECIMERPNRKREWEKVLHQYRFFQNKCLTDIKFCDEKFEKLFKLSSKLQPNCNSISSYITFLPKILHLESYICEDINIEAYTTCQYSYCGCHYSINMPTESLNFYPKNVINFFKQTGFKVSRTFESEFEDKRDFFTVLITKLLTINIQPDKKIELIKQVLYSNSFINLVNAYKYDLKALLEYCFNYLEPFEGLTIRESLNLLEDYYRMGSEIGRKLKRYPKYLKSIHDIIQANYNAKQREYDEQLFAEAKQPELEYEHDKFCIVIPDKTADIISEGTDLNHCVSSYVDKILRKETYIVFLRAKKDKESSLVTVEIQNKKLIQAKGSYNRNLTEDEKNFLIRFTKKKELELFI